VPSCTGTYSTKVKILQPVSIILWMNASPVTSAWFDRVTVREHPKKNACPVKEVSGTSLGEVYP